MAPGAAPDYEHTNKHIHSSKKQQVDSKGCCPEFICTLLGKNCANLQLTPQITLLDTFRRNSGAGPWTDVHTEKRHPHMQQNTPTHPAKTHKYKDTPTYTKDTPHTAKRHKYTVS